MAEETMTRPRTGPPRVKLEECVICERMVPDAKRAFFNRLPICRPCYFSPTHCEGCGIRKPIGEHFNSLYPRYCSLACMKKNAPLFYQTELKKEVAKLAGIDLNLFPASEAADFYLLVELALDQPDQRWRLDAKASYLAQQFSRYMLYAIGGEIRHYEWGRYYSEGVGICREVDPVRGDDIATWLQDARVSPQGREGVWIKWGKTAIPKFGEILLIRICHAIFSKGSWPGSMGGKKWGTIAETLLMFKQGETSNLTFVDTAWGLKHNGALHLNKLWSVHCLQEVLDANQEGNKKLLKIFASRKVKEVLNDKKVPSSTSGTMQSL